MTTETSDTSATSASPANPLVPHARAFLARGKISELLDAIAEVMRDSAAKEEEPVHPGETAKDAAFVAALADRLYWKWQVYGTDADVAAAQKRTIEEVSITSCKAALDLIVDASREGETIFVATKRLIESSAQFDVLDRAIRYWVPRKHTEARPYSVFAGTVNDVFAAIERHRKDSTEPLAKTAQRVGDQAAMWTEMRDELTKHAPAEWAKYGVDVIAHLAGAGPCDAPNPRYRAEPWRFLHESGLLFKINRDVLHPLGMALEITREKDGSCFFSGLWWVKDDPEGITFGEEWIVEGVAKLVAYSKAEGRARLLARQAALGFIVEGKVTKVPAKLDDLREELAAIEKHLASLDEARSAETEPWQFLRNAVANVAIVSLKRAARIVRGPRQAPAPPAG